MGKTLAALLAMTLLHTTPAVADPFVFTYSYSNLLDGRLDTMLSASQLRAATEESLGVWSRYAPLEFHEVADAGPPPSDDDYPAAGTPDIRIGHHDAAFSHAFLTAPGGLAHDVHLLTQYDQDDFPFYWGLGDDPSPFAVDVLATLVHELGHALGLEHHEGAPSLMNGTVVWAYPGLGTAFLFPDDILNIQALYGAGTGSVHPMDDVLPTPEPGTLLLLSIPLASLIDRRRRRCRRAALQGCRSSSSLPSS